MMKYPDYSETFDYLTFLNGGSEWTLKEILAKVKPSHPDASLRSVMLDMRRLAVKYPKWVTDLGYPYPKALFAVDCP